MEGAQNGSDACPTGPACPHCGRSEEVAEAIQLRPSQGTGELLLGLVGGWLCGLLWGAGRPHRLHCRACQVTFEVAARSSKVLRVIAVILLVVVLAAVLSAELGE